MAGNLRQRLNYPQPGRSAVEELLARDGGADRAAIAELARARSQHRELRSSDEVRVARSLDRPVAAVHGAASYYADLRGARGARHVRVCNGTACFVASGGGRHIAEIEQALGVTCGTCAPDGSVSLQAVRCLGYCYAGPSALDGDRPCVGPDLAAQLTRAAEPRAPEVPVRAVAAPIVLRGIVKGDSSWLLWPSVLGTGRAERVQYEVRESGLRGRGGAGFPVARKWDAVAASLDGGPRYVVANGDEGDPGSYADRLLMERDPTRVLEGLALAALACGAARGVVYVRSEYPQAFARMTDAVIEAREAGHLGHNVHGSGIDLDIEVVSGAGSYVAGEETSLLRSIEGLRGTVRPRPPLPVEHGLWGRPTAVNNIETLAAVPAIVADGGAAYAGLGGTGESGTLLVCLNERFARPGAYEVELGTILRDIVEGLGGGLADGRPLTAVQIGGPLGGFVAPAQLDLPLLNSALAAAGVALGHGSLVAIDERTSPRSILDHLWRFGADESCGACTPCREGTRRGAADPTGATADDGLLDLMAQASLCGFGRGIPRAVRSLCRAVPMDS